MWACLSKISILTFPRVLSKIATINCGRFFTSHAIYIQKSTLHGLYELIRTNEINIFLHWSRKASSTVCYKTALFSKFTSFTSILNRTF